MYLEDGKESSGLYVNSKNTSVGFAYEGSVAPQLIFSYGVILLFEFPQYSDNLFQNKFDKCCRW